MARSRDRTEFGQRMFEAREGAGLTQMQVCERLKMSQGTLSGLERSAHGTKRLIEFAMLYRVEPRWLASGEGERSVAVALVVGGPDAGYDVDGDDARDLLADFCELLPQDQEKLRAQLHERAEEMRRYTELVLRRARAKGGGGGQR